MFFPFWKNLDTDTGNDKWMEKILKDNEDGEGSGKSVSTISFPKTPGEDDDEFFLFPEADNKESNGGDKEVEEVGEVGEVSEVSDGEVSEVSDGEFSDGRGTESDGGESDGGETEESEGKKSDDTDEDYGTTDSDEEDDASKSESDELKSENNEYDAVSLTVRRFEYLFCKAFDFIRDTEGHAREKLHLLVNKLAGDSHEAVHMPLIRFALNMYANTENSSLSEDIIFFVRRAFDIWRCETSEKFLSFLQCLEKRVCSQDMAFFVERFQMRGYQPGVLARVFEAGIRARTGFHLLNVVVERNTHGSAVRVRAQELEALSKRLQEEHLMDYNIRGTLQPSSYLTKWTRKLYQAYTEMHVHYYILKDLSSMAKGFEAATHDVDVAESVTYCKDFL